MTDGGYVVELDASTGEVTTREATPLDVSRQEVAALLTSPAEGDGELRGLAYRMRALAAQIDPDACTDPLGCHCFCHVTLDTHVPVCHLCTAPLAGLPDKPDLPGWAVCRTPGCANDNQPVPPAEWWWAARDVFDGHDLPPWNGYPTIVPAIALPLTPTVVL